MHQVIRKSYHREYPGRRRSRQEIKEWLADCLKDLNCTDHFPFGQGVQDFNHADGAPLAGDTFLALTCSNILGAVLNLVDLSDRFHKEPEEASPCQLLNCPRLSAMKQTLAEAIEVINRTKNSFKSRELGELRVKLEEFIRKCG